MNPDVVGQSISSFQNFARLPGRTCVIDDQLDVFVFRQITDDLRIDPRDGLEFSRPVTLIVGPREPCGGVRFPLGRHAVAVCFLHDWILHYPTVLVSVSTSARNTGLSTREASSAAQE